MKKKKLLLSSLLVLSIFSCREDDDMATETIIDSKENKDDIKKVKPVVVVNDCANLSTFGIRHDKKLSTHEAIAANQIPYNTSEYPDFSSVVNFEYIEDGVLYDFSGTLISPEWILTAAHNLIERKDDMFFEIPATDVLVKTGSNPNTSINNYKVSKIIVHPAYLTDYEDYKNYDMCLVKLSKPITSIKPAKLNFSTDNLLKNKVWTSGYGVYKKEQGQDPNKESKRSAVQNTIDKIAEDEFTFEKETFKTIGLIVDFDNPCGNSNTLSDNKNIITQALSPITSDARALNFEGVLVKGDSGGPMFAKTNGQWQVVGVNAYELEEVGVTKPSNYGAIMVNIGVSPYKSWIEATLKNSVTSKK